MPAAAIAIRAILRPNFDGSLRTTNPLGDYHPSPTLVVDKSAFATALGSLIGLLVGGAAINFNLAGAWLTGTDSGIATFGVRTINGDEVASHNWGISTTNLTQSLVSGSIGGGTLEIYALDSSLVEYQMGRFSWSVASGAGTDTLAPNVPTGLTVTPGSGTLVCTIDAASDPYDNATAPAGVDHYDVFADGVLNQQVTAASRAATPLALTNIGAFSPTPTAVQSGSTWTLTAAGTGIHNTPTEQCLFVGTQMTGDGSLIAKLNAYTSANAFSTSGLMVRETLAQGAIFGALYMQPSGGGNGFQFKRRATTGGNGANVASASGLTSGWVKLTRAGTTFTASYSTDGNNFTVLATVTLAMGTSAYWGLFLASQTGGTTCSSTITDVNLNNVPGIGFTVTTAVARALTVKAIDAKGNTSAACAGVTGTPANGQPGNVIKFHGGHYPCLGLGVTSTASIFPFLDSIANDTSITGIQIDGYWATLDNGATAPDYAAGRAYIQSILDRLSTYSRKIRLIFGIEDRTFGGSPGSPPSSRYPKWVCDFHPDWVICAAAGTTFSGSGLGTIANFSLAAPRDALIACLQQYGAWFNSHPLFECLIILGESTAGGVPSSYNTTNLYTNIPIIFHAARLAWPNTRLRWRANYVNENGASSQMTDMFALLRPDQVELGGPDPDLPGPVSNTRPIAANSDFIGVSGPTPKIDFRGTMAFCSEVQALGLGFNITSTPSAIYTLMQSRVNSQTFVWLVNNNYGGAPQKWSTGELPFIHSAPPLNAVFPSNGSYSSAN